MASRSKKMAELNRNRIDLGQSPPAAFKRANEEVMAHPEQGGRFMTMNRNMEKFSSTIGDLVVALSDAAFEFVRRRGTLIFLWPWPSSVFLVEHSEIEPQSRPSY